MAAVALREPRARAVAEPRAAPAQLAEARKAAVARPVVDPPAVVLKAAARPAVVECKAAVLQAAVAPRAELALKVAAQPVAGSRRLGAGRPVVVAAARAVER